MRAFLLLREALATNQELVRKVWWSSDRTPPPGAQTPHATPSLRRAVA